MVEIWADKCRLRGTWGILAHILITLGFYTILWLVHDDGQSHEFKQMAHHGLLSVQTAIYEGALLT